MVRVIWVLRVAFILGSRTTGGCAWNLFLFDWVVGTILSKFSDLSLLLVVEYLWPDGFSVVSWVLSLWLIEDLDYSLHEPY